MVKFDCEEDRRVSAGKILSREKHSPVMYLIDWIAVRRWQAANIANRRRCDFRFGQIDFAQVRTKEEQILQFQTFWKYAQREDPQLKSFKLTWWIRAWKRKHTIHEH